MFKCLFKSNFINKTMAMLLAFTMISGIIIIQPVQVKASSETYYVDWSSGDDSRTAIQAQNSNTPWQTIQRAASAADAGDTIRIMEGTYRETVIPANSGTSGSPITFMPFEDDIVTISGANDAGTSGWTVHSGAIYQKTVTLPFGVDNQVFIDGEQAELARTPNKSSTSFDPFDIPWSTANSTTSTTITDTDLTQANDYWNGYNATVLSLGKWTINGTEITDFNSTTRTLALNAANLTTSWGAMDTHYYISGKHEDLDYGNEWQYAANTLYIQTPTGNSPANHLIEYKARKNAFDLSSNQNQYINITGLNLFAATIDAGQASHCVIDSIHAQYVSHYVMTQNTTSDTFENDTVGQVPANYTQIAASGLVSNTRGYNGSSNSLRIYDNTSACTQLVRKNYPSEAKKFEFYYYPVSFASGYGSVFAVKSGGDSVSNSVFEVMIKSDRKVYWYNGSSWVKLSDVTALSGAWNKIRIDAGNTLNASVYVNDTLAGTISNVYSFPTMDRIVFCSTGGAATGDDYYIDDVSIFDADNIDSDNSDNSGIILGGSGNTLKNSTVTYSPGALVMIKGIGNMVYNNLLENGAYGPSGSTRNALIRVFGQDHLISGNTARNSGRGCLSGYFSNIRVQYNDFSNAMKLTDDGGVIYIGFSDFGNSEIHHNWIHDCPNGQGIYFDNSSRSFIVYRNVIWNVHTAIVLNYAANFGMIFNNSIHTPTASDVDIGSWGIAGLHYQDTYGTRVENNIMCHNTDTKGTAVFSNNIVSGDPSNIYEDIVPADYNFSLKSGSPAIDTGSVISGVTDGYGGDAPDKGAYEYGQTPWIPGCDFNNPVTPTFQNTSLLYSNKVKNSGFERTLSFFGDTSHEFDDWTKTNACTALVNTEWAGGGNPVKDRTGNYGVELPSSANGNGLQQTITGLSPNTIYVLSAWIRLAGTGGIAKLGVKDYGGAESSMTETGTTWGIKEVSFKTGPNTTSATIYLMNDPSSTQSVYADDFGVICTNLDITATDTFENDTVGQVPVNYTQLAVSTLVSNTRGYNGSGKSLRIYDNSTANTNVVRKTVSSTYKAFEFYYYPVSFASGYGSTIAICSGGNSSTDTIFEITIKNDRKVYWYDGSEKLLSNTAVVQTNSWNHVVINVRNTAYADIYVNGILVGTINNWNDSATVDRIKFCSTGGAATGDDYYIDDMEFYNNEFSDGFENGLVNWTQYKGTATTSTVQKHGGSYSYLINEDTDVVYHIFDMNYNRKVSMWFYDDATDQSMYCLGFVDNDNQRALGVNTSISTSKYVYHISGTGTASGVTRTTGWHKFEWDYTSGSKVDMYIDGTLVASPTGVGYFSRIVIGDLWADYRSGTNYFDDIVIE